MTPRVLLTFSTRQYGNGRTVIFTLRFPFFVLALPAMEDTISGSLGVQVDAVGTWLVASLQGSPLDAANTLVILWRAGALFLHGCFTAVVSMPCNEHVWCFWLAADVS